VTIKVHKNVGDYKPSRCSGQKKLYLIMRDGIVMCALEGAELATLTDIFSDLDAMCEEITGRMILIPRHLSCFFSVFLAEISS